MRAPSAALYADRSCGCGHTHAAAGGRHAAAAPLESASAAILEAHGVDPAPVLAALRTGRPIPEAVSTQTAATQVGGHRARLVRDMLEAEAQWRARSQAIENGVDPFTGDEISGAAQAKARAAAAADLEAAFAKAVEEGWGESYRLGHAMRTGEAPRALSDSAAAKMARQQAFARQFARDIAEGIPQERGRMPVGQRAQLYGNALDGAFNAGAVDGGTEGELIYWRLGGGDHCEDCPVLAISGPYTRNTLPTYPRAGETVCRSNCSCFLEFVTRGGTRIPLDEPPPVVSTVLSPPPAPPGLRLPTPDEQRVIDDLQSRVDFARRKIAETKGTAEQRRWIQARRDANAKLNELLNERGIWAPPKLSVGEVIRGDQIGGKDVGDLVRGRGIDGPTARRGDAAARAKALDAEQSRLGQSIAGLPPEAPGSVEDVQRLLVRMGAPPELFEAVGSVEAPAPVVLQSVGSGLAATLRQHLTALRVLSDGEHAVEVGPFDDDWEILVGQLGTWIRGAPDDVAAFLEAWGLAVDTEAPPAVVQWRPIA